MSGECEWCGMPTWPATEEGEVVLCIRCADKAMHADDWPSYRDWFTGPLFTLLLGAIVLGCGGERDPDFQPSRPKLCPIMEPCTQDSDCNQVAGCSHARCYHLTSHGGRCV